MDSEESPIGRGPAGGDPTPVSGPDAAWRLLLAARAEVDAGRRPGERAAPGGPGRPDAAAAELIDLFLPLALTPREAGHRVAILGQTLDGFIATESGDSRYINGDAALAHLHRTRALCDAVIVGASTAALDEPRLTTRHAEGPNAVRVVIDPNGRLPAASPLLRDGEAPTLVVRAAADGDAREERLTDQASLLLLPAAPGGGGLDPAGIVAALRGRGLTRLLVEGGGDTVGRFLAAGALDRLQLLVAPILLGGGRPAVRLPPAERLSGALRPACRRHAMGEDVLYDFRLGDGGSVGAVTPG